jgi:hypothetical protein
MKFIGKALALGLAAAAVTVAACSSQPNQSPTSTGSSNPTPEDNTGSVGLKYTLPSGQTINTINYTLTNGTNTYTGTINVAGSSSISFVVGGVASGSGYTIALTAVTTDGTTNCSGTSAPFSVTNRNTTAVTVQLVCTTASDSGSVQVNPVTNNCPIWNTIVANPSTLTTTAPGNVSLVTASATGPSNNSLTYAWTVLSGTGTLGGQSAQGTTNSTISFTCPATGESDVVQVVVTDQAGAQCPAADTTATVTIVCGSVPCLGVGSGTEATPDTAAGTCPTGQSNSLKDSSGNFCCAATPCFGVGSGVEATPDTAAGTCPAGQTNSAKDAQGNFCCAVPVLVPCTSAGQTFCVQCQGNAANNGICTPTEATLVQHDINLKIATAAGPDPAAGCYSCLNSKHLLDDNLGDTGNECEDALTNGTATQCQAVLSCVLGSGTGTTGSSCAGAVANNCYCGSAAAGSACSTAGLPGTGAGSVNGVCDTQIVAGLPSTDNTSTNILKDLENQTDATGIAMSIFQGAISNKCGACLE